MIEMVSSAGVVVALTVDRAWERLERARHRRRLLELASCLPAGCVIGEQYGKDAGWSIVLPSLATATAAITDAR